MAAASRGNNLKIWNVGLKVECATLTGHTEQVHACAWSPDGSRLVSAAHDGMIRIWDTRSAKPVGVVGQQARGLLMLPDSLATCAWSSDGSRIAAAARSNALLVWDPKKGRTPDRLAGHQSYVSACAWSADGTKLASADRAGVVKVWDAGQLKELFSLRGHDGPICACAFIPGGLLLTGGTDRTVRVWNVETATCVAAFPAEGEVHSIAAHPRRPLFAAGHSGGKLVMLALEMPAAARA